jgi:hypothetical protein
MPGFGDYIPQGTMTPNSPWLQALRLRMQQAKLGRFGQLGHPYGPWWGESADVNPAQGLGYDQQPMPGGLDFAPGSPNAVNASMPLGDAGATNPGIDFAQAPLPQGAGQMFTGIQPMSNRGLANAVQRASPRNQGLDNALSRVGSFQSYRPVSGAASTARSTSGATKAAKVYPTPKKTMSSNLKNKAKIGG